VVGTGGNVGVNGWEFSRAQMAFYSKIVFPKIISCTHLSTPLQVFFVLNGKDFIEEGFETFSKQGSRSSCGWNEPTSLSEDN
jgi:hypothetical protein